MEVNNRHLKPKPGGYFTIQSPMGKSIGVQSHFRRHFKSDERDSKQESSVVTDDPQSGSHSGTSNSIGWEFCLCFTSDCLLKSNITRLPASVPLNSTPQLGSQSFHQLQPQQQQQPATNGVWLSHRSGLDCGTSSTTNSISSNSPSKIFDSRIPIYV